LPFYTESITIYKEPTPKWPWIFLAVLIVTIVVAIWI
jgi:hypothetical protein